MKKKLLLSLFAVALFAGQAIAADYCTVTVGYSYTHVSKVELADMVNETNFIQGYYHFNNYSNDYVAGLEVGQTYPLTVTVQNWNSGDADSYGVTVWFDWNGDGILDETTELVGTEIINEIGTPGTETSLVFNVTVPDDVYTEGEFGFRVMMFYNNGTDGTAPCPANIESGDIEDYGAVIGTGRMPEVVLPTEVCAPGGYYTVAYISDVEFDGTVLSNNGITDEMLPFAQDFRDAENPIEIEKGQSYTLDVTSRIFVIREPWEYDITGSPVTVRAYVDWNNDLILSEEETQKEFIDAIQGENAVDPDKVSFTITAPADAEINTILAMRVFVHETNGMYGEYPCGSVGFGQYQDFYIKVIDEEIGGVNKVSANSVAVYPTLTDGIVNINKNMSVTGYSLFSIDGRLIQKENRSVGSIDMTSYPKGIYVIKVQTVNGDITQKIVLK